MLTPAERRQVCRDRKRAQGICLECPAPATYGVRCFNCALKHSNYVPWLLIVMRRLAENRCATCGALKRKYTDVNCRKHKSGQRIAA